MLSCRHQRWHSQSQVRFRKDWMTSSSEWRSRLTPGLAHWTTPPHALLSRSCGGIISCRFRDRSPSITLILICNNISDSLRQQRVLMPHVQAHLASRVDVRIESTSPSIGCLCCDRGRLFRIFWQSSVMHSLSLSQIYLPPSGNLTLN